METTSRSSRDSSRMCEAVRGCCERKSSSFETRSSGFEGENRTGGESGVRAKAKGVERGLPRLSRRGLCTVE